MVQLNTIKPKKKHGLVVRKYNELYIAIPTCGKKSNNACIFVIQQCKLKLNKCVPLKTSLYLFCTKIFEVCKHKSAKELIYIY